ncbi:MAG: glycolate oxidase subunit GlcE [Alphaproteobacteria bacterium]|nr:glycolate oxidase subunit GlcE [Alphaproteobacteria bacterium]
MAPRLRPADASELCDIVRAAVADGAALDLMGAGTKRGLGRPAEGEVLDLSRLSGVVSYEPDELVLRVRAATPMAEIERLLAQSGQHLAFEPPDLAALWGEEAGRQTIGGVIACNLSGPRRFRAGAARDHLLGFAAVNGRGEAFKAGGHVVKNVTGYDLCKLMAGSHGTLAALTEITVKALPAPEESRTLVVSGLAIDAAVRAMAVAAGSPFETTGIAHLPASRAGLAGLSSDTAATLVRCEGPEPALRAATEALTRELGAFGTVTAFNGDTSRAVWRAVRDVAPLFPDRDRVLWRLSVAPAAAPAIVRDIEARFACAVALDWAGGRLWIEPTEAGEDGGADAVRRAAAPGHAVLVRAPAALRSRIAPIDPGPPAARALAERIKDSFDPRRVFGRGRMFAGV